MRRNTKAPVENRKATLVTFKRIQINISTCDLPAMTAMAWNALNGKKRKRSELTLSEKEEQILSFDAEDCEDVSSRECAAAQPRERENNSHIVIALCSCL